MTDNDDDDDDDVDNQKWEREKAKTDRNQFVGGGFNIYGKRSRLKEQGFDGTGF